MQHKIPQFKVRSDIRSGAGYVDGVYYPDMSGTCTGTTPTPPTPVPPVSGGGDVNGVYYPDMSGTCTA